MEKSNKRIFSIMQPRNSEKPKNELSIKCCVINESEIFKTGLVSVLQKVAGLEDTEGYTRDEYLQLEDSTNIDVIIGEIEFNGTLDVEFVKTMRKLNPDSTIIIYTHIKNNEFRNYSIHCGADFFVFVEERFNLIEHLISGISRKMLRKRNIMLQKKRVNELGH
jgi:DNA-binding NarL/FixJ family response regulator